MGGRILGRSRDKCFECGGDEGLLVLSLSPFSPLELWPWPNHFFRRFTDGVGLAARLVDRLLELLPLRPCSLSARAKLDGALEEVSVRFGVVSTSSAARHHFLRRVYRSQPSWLRRALFHFNILLCVSL